jgi:thioredoxin reductase (NADPH)
VDDVRNLIIVGSGPAGYTAAVYAARANLAPLVIEGVTSGGALMTTTDVENYPGVSDGILGPELMDNFRKQAERFGAEFITDDASRVKLDGDVKSVWVGDVEYRARAVIIATGSAWRPLGVPGEQELLGHGVSSCATCDGFFFRGQHIAVVGGGDSAMEEATFLTRFAEKVTIVHRRDQFRASKIMAHRALSNPKIEVLWDHVVVEVLDGGGKVGGLQVRNVKTGEEQRLDVTGVFVAIGHDPRSELFTGQVAIDDAGYVKVEAPTTRTNLVGVFAAGDVVDHTYRQAVTAAGTGCAAALDAERYIASLETDH